MDDAFKSDDSKQPGAEACQPGEGQDNKNDQGLGPRRV